MARAQNRATSLGSFSGSREGVNLLDDRSGGPRTAGDAPNLCAVVAAPPSAAPPLQPLTPNRWRVSWGQWYRQPDDLTSPRPHLTASRSANPSEGPHDGDVGPIGVRSLAALLPA